MNKKTGYFIFMSLLSIISLHGCINKTIEYHSIENYNENDDIKGPLTVNGSTSMSKLSNALIENFSYLYPNTEIEQSDMGSGAAVTSVLNGVSLLGNVSRDLKSYELSKKINVITIAFDGIAVIVNKKNPVKSLSSKEITRIFTGEINNWETFGFKSHPIVLVGREEASGTRDSFESTFGLDKMKCPYSIELPETGDIIAKVTSDESAIGYISTASLSSSVTPLNIDNVAPTQENIQNKTYKVFRPFNQIYLKSSSELNLIRLWFEFIFSEQGKKIITNERLIPAEPPDNLKM